MTGGPVYVLGDVQGWTARLEEALRAVGGDCATGTLPDGVTVVQVGDLVHKGPDSAGALAVADRFMAGSPGRWVQLVGNHEAQYLGGPVFWDRDTLGDLHRSDLAQWAADGSARVAVALQIGGSLPDGGVGDVLVTHAGLTAWKWDALGRPRSAADAADALNAEMRSDPAAAYAAGYMLSRRPMRHVGVVWAETAGELLASWDGQRLPFSQVHGHSAARDWRRGLWRADTARRLALSGVGACADDSRRHETFEWPDGRLIVGIDPGYGTRGADAPLCPLAFDATIP